MKPVVVSDTLAVGEFPTPEQLVILARAGFKAVINNQPDGEVERFQPASEIEAEARRHGLAYAYAPLSSRTPPADELARYGEAVGGLPAPIYAFCYSGARSAAGCALLLTGSLEVDRIVAEFGASGFDLEGLRPWLDEERARVAPKDAGVPTSAPGAAGKPAGVVAGTAPVVNGSGNGHANGNGHGAASANGASSTEAAPAIGRPTTGKGLPRMVVVQPRAAGFSGFAV